MLFSSKEGSVAVQDLDVTLLQDEGLSLLRAVEGSFGLQQLHIRLPGRVSEKFFSSLLRYLSKNQMIHTLSIGSSFGGRFDLDDTRTRTLAQVLRVNASITKFACLRCDFSDRGWKMLWNAIKGNSSLTFLDTSFSTSRSSLWIRDDPIVDAFNENTTVVCYKFSKYYHNRNFGARIEPFLQRNRTQKLSRDIATENCQTKRWRIIGQSLRQAKFRGSGPDVLFAFLRNNVDNWVSYAPTGRDVVERQLQKVDAQRAALLAKLRQYDDPPLEGSPATRKRKSSEGVTGEGHGGSRPKLDHYNNVAKA